MRFKSLFFYGPPPSKTAATENRFPSVRQYQITSLSLCVSVFKYRHSQAHLTASVAAKPTATIKTLLVFDGAKEKKQLFKGERQLLGRTFSPPLKERLSQEKHHLFFFFKEITQRASTWKQKSLNKKETLEGRDSTSKPLAQLTLQTEYLLHIAK